MNHLIHKIVIVWLRAKKITLSMATGYHNDNKIMVSNSVLDLHMYGKVNQTLILFGFQLSILVLLAASSGLDRQVQATVVTLIRGSGLLLHA
jgi:hypothetical protein